MGFLSDILNTVKKNTLDKTNLDEQLMQGISNAGKSAGNFFTKTLPQWSGSADRYLQHPTMFQDLTSSKTLKGKKTLQGPLERLVIEPTAKVIDAGIGGAYRIGKQTTGVNDMLNREQQVRAKYGLPPRDAAAMQPSAPPKASDVLDAIGIAGAPKVIPNMIGGGIGATFKTGENIKGIVSDNKPLSTIFNDVGPAYDQGFAFSSKLGPFEEIIGAGGQIIKNAVPKPVYEKIITNPIVQKVVKGMTPEEVTGWGTWLKNSLRAGQKSGFTMALYGAMEDAKNGEERLRNMWEQYKQGAIFSTVQHGAMSTPALANAKIADIKYPEANKLADIIGKATDKANPPQMQMAESSFTIPEQKNKKSDIFKNETELGNLDDLIKDQPFQGAGPYKTVKEYMAGYKKRTGKVVMMTPDEYLSKIRYDEPTPSSIEFMKKKLAKGEKLAMPSLDYTGGTLEQEGRNRAYLAKELGIEKIPVLVAEKIPSTPQGGVKPLNDLFAKKQAEIDAKRAQYEQNPNNTPLDITKLNEKYVQQEKLSQRPLPMARTEPEAKAIRSIADAMEVSSKHFDRTKAEKALVHLFNNSTPEQQAEILRTADFSLGDKSIKKFWDTHLPRVSGKKVTLKEFVKQREADWKAADESLVAPEQRTVSNPDLKVSNDIKPVQTISKEAGGFTPLTSKKMSEIKGMKQVSSPESINRGTSELDSFVPKQKITNNKMAETEGKRFLQHHENVKNQVLELADKYGVSRSDLTDIIQGKKEIPKGFEGVINSTREYIKKLHSFRENPDLGYIDNYLQHIRKGDISNEVAKVQVGADLWLPDNVMDLGSTKQRKGLIEDTHVKDFNQVWDRMGEEAMYDKYRNNYDITPEQKTFREKVISTVKEEIKGNVAPKDSKLNIVRESTKSQGITDTKDITYNKKPLIQRFNGFLDAMKREAPELANSTRRVRDAWRDMSDLVGSVNTMNSREWAELAAKELGSTAGGKDTIIRALSHMDEKEKSLYAQSLMKGMTKKRIQDFIGEVGKYRFTTDTEKYVNEQINRLLKTNSLSESLYAKVVRHATSATYRAQIWGNVSVAMQQALETFRIPAVYEAQDIIPALKQIVSNRVKKRSLVNEYKFGENDFRQLQQQIDGYHKKQVKGDGLFSKIGDIMTNVGEAMVKFTENSKNEAFLTVAEVKGKRLGLEGQKLKDFVRDELFTNGYIMDKFNTPEFLQKSATGRLLGQYSQFFFKDMERILDAAGVEKDMPLAMKLIASKVAQIVFTAAVTGAGIDSLKRVALPIGFGPVTTAAWTAGNILYNVEQEKEQGKKDPENADTYYQDTEAQQFGNLAMGNIVPYGSQIKKTKGAIDVLRKGYDETSTGRITYKAEDNPFVQGQTLVFGKGVGKNSRNFFAKEKGLFGSGEDVPLTDIKGVRKYTSATPSRSKVIKDVFARGYKDAGREMIDQNMQRQDVYREFNDKLTPSEKTLIASISLPKDKDKLGNILNNANNTSVRMAESNMKWANPDLMAKITEREKEIANRTGLPMNPLYELDPSQQSTYFRIKSLPKGDPKRKELEQLAAPWLQPFYKASEQYSESATKQGLFADNPNYDSTLKPSKELQLKLDVYNKMSKEDRKIYLKENPDIVDYFNQVSLQTNLEQLQLGLVPNIVSEMDALNKGGSGYGSSKKSSTSLKKLLASNKSLRKQMEGISVSKQSKLLQTILNRTKTTTSGPKRVTINTKPSKSFTK